MEDTQVIDWEVDEEEEAERCPDSLGCHLQPLGRLHVFSSAHGPEKDFPLYLGKNVVGRMPDCSVALPFPSISKQHAVIEILASDKAPVLRDCGSLNGTQTLRPPKALSPGVSHRLRDQELILFADLPCQYHRLDVPLPFVSRGPLTVEETPRVQAGARPQGLLLAEDSEEEVDFLSERCVVKESRPPSSPLATVVPESDDEGAPPAPVGPGPPFAFDLESDTDEGEQPASGDTSSAVRRDAPAGVGGAAAELHRERSQPSVKEADGETEMKSATDRVVPPTGVILERGQPVEGDSDTDVDDDKLPGRPADVHWEGGEPSASTGSDTDVEEEGLPATPAMVPVKKRQVFHGAGPESPGAPPLAHPQESLAGGGAAGKGAPPAIPQERSPCLVVIDSDTDGEEEVSAALALSLLKESRAVTGRRDAGVEEGRARPGVLVEQSQTSAGQDSDTDIEEEGLAGEKRQSVLKGHTDKAGAPIAHSGRSCPPPGDSDGDVVGDQGSPGVCLQRSHASTMVDISTEAEGDVPAGPAGTRLEKLQVPEGGTGHTDVGAEGSPAKLPVVVPPEEAQLPPDCGEDAEEGTSLAASDMADVRKSQCPAEGDAGTEWAAAVLEQERALEAGAQGGSPVAQEEQDLLPVSRKSLTGLVVGTGTPREPIQPHREGAQTPLERGRAPHVQGTKDSEDSRDDSEDLDLQATQCFVESGHRSLEGALDEPWEVLATQPFCLREAEASEAQHSAAPREAHGPCSSPPRATPRDPQPESPADTEPLGSQSRGVHATGKDAGTPRKTAERATSERESLERETENLPPGEGEPAGRVQEREHQQLLARASQRQESDKNTKNANTGGDRESLKAETDTSKETQEKEIEETLGREIIEREAERPAPESHSEPAGLEGKPARAIAERGTQGREPEPRSQAQATQGSFPPAAPAVGPGAPQGQASAPVTPGSRSGGGRAAPVSTRKPRRGRSTCKMPLPKKTSRGQQEPAEAAQPPPAPDTPAPLPGCPKPRATSQNREQAVPQPLPSPPPLSSGLPAPRTRPGGGPGAPGRPPPSGAEPSVRPRRPSRVTPSPGSASALKPRPATPLTRQPASPEPASQATRGQLRRSSEMTPALGEPTAPEPAPQAAQGSTRRSSVKTPVPVEPTVPEPAPQAARGSTRRSSVKTPVPVEPTVPKPAPQAAQGSTQGSSVKTPAPMEATVPEPAPRAARGSTRRSSVKTPVPVEPTVPEPAPQAAQGSTRGSSVKTPAPVEPTAPEPAPQAARGSTRRPSVKTPAPVEATVPEPAPQATRGSTRRPSVKTPAPMEATVPEPAPQAARGSTRGSSVKTPEPVPTAPEPAPRAARSSTRGSSVKTPEPVPTAPEPAPRAARGSTRGSSVKTPEPVPTAPEPAPRAARGSTRGSSVKTPEPVPTAPEPAPRAARGSTRGSSVKTPELVVPTALERPPSTPTERPTPESAAQVGLSRTLRSSSVRAVLAPTAPARQPPAPTDRPGVAGLDRQARGRRAPAACRRPTSPAGEPGCAPPGPAPRSCRSPRRAVRAAGSPATVPAAPQARPLEAGAVGVPGSTPEPQPQASQGRKRPLEMEDSGRPRKRPPRAGPPKRESLGEDGTTEGPPREEDAVVPAPSKRKRGGGDGEPELEGALSRSLRRTRADLEPATPRVLFTGVVDARAERAVLALGGGLAGSVAEASHLVTDRVRRTVKFLCALGRGLPILSLDWLYQSRQAGCFLPPDAYVVADPEQERAFGFSLRDALSRARQRRLLEGYEVHVTPGVQPPPPQMGEIISCCGGTVLSSMPRSYKPQRVVITCSQDLRRCALPLRAGLPLLSPEFLLTGVLKQEAQPEAFLLSTGGAPPLKPQCPLPPRP
ncbi:mediator of DNA damage checkpoint protein 1 isoform X2 [Dasypus novemcinctus]|uniref:mediator of DNA damage checkpoint protein 1 isoform X2 n=2 Tax=Dasypus novemcinctus TaxID=9361 RepID=UPI00265D6C84|nr:mediator of DNA damage checkpoint protein 1 isoform X2 [Dasypus novemcinctus]XP_058141484.1 mediator of DNA damage checkpoint protein 1 isoform X2 [Dasypus novemcinctus]XP_058141485.1 mediator of DNA damage checkpoint protein 1 isoform X2 [Dasypus novemcinctus]